MAFTLGDVENDCLAELGSTNPSPNFGASNAPAYPNWASGAMPMRFPQYMVDQAIIQAVDRIIRGLVDTGLITFSFTFPSVSQQFRYTIPQGNLSQGTVAFSGTPRAGIVLTLTIGGVPITYTTTANDTSLPAVTAKFLALINASAVSSTVITQVSPMVNLVNTLVLSAPQSGSAGNAVTLAASSSDTGAQPLTMTVSGPTLTGGTDTSPGIMQVRRVYYQPFGMPYIREKMPGARLISWTRFQQMTGGGYLSAFSFSQEPEYCAIDASDRSSLQFFPAPVASGDLITVTYVPQMTSNTGDPMLVNQGDIIPLPDEMRDLVKIGALMRLWPVDGEFALRREYAAMFKEELSRTREDWEKSNSGETLQITNADDIVSVTGQYTSGWSF
jgi:hypothetical protein